LLLAPVELLSELAAPLDPIEPLLLLVSEELPWCFLCFLPLVWLVSVELWLDCPLVPLGDDAPDVPAPCPPFDVEPCIPPLLELSEFVELPLVPLWLLWLLLLGFD
jgi:hypothetical protein